MQIPPHFIEAILGDPRKCLLLVGAGLSCMKVREGQQSLPNWHELMARMVRELEQRDCDLATIADARQLLDAGDYLGVAQRFKDSIRPDEFARFLRKELDPQDLVTNGLHRLIVATEFRGIITTNFDCVIEFHSDRFHPMVYPQFLEEPGTIRLQPFLAKIHGCIRATANPAANLILTEQDYRNLRANQRYQTLLRTLILGHTLLTVGFSLKDPDFLAIVDDLYAVFGETMPTSYALVRRPAHDDRAEWLKRGVVLIPYEEHRDLRGFFAELHDISERKYPKLNLVASPLIFTKVSEVRGAAWAFYSQWRKQGSRSPRFGEVRITLKGWRHVTRVSRPQQEVCHKLMLLRCAKELIEKQTSR